MLIIAHRGASGHAAENTLAAIAKALELGADAIELDLQCVEGTLVAFHDRYLNHKTNGKGPLSQHTLESLSQISFKNGETIPTLWQILKLAAARCDFNLELKGHDTVEPLLALLRRAEEELGYRSKQFAISSFHHGLLEQVKAARPELKIGALISHIPQDLAASAERLGADSLNVDVDFVHQALVDDAHRRGLKIYVYTVDQAEDLQAMRDLGVDGVFSNYPDQARQLLGGATRQPGQCW